MKALDQMSDLVQRLRDEIYSTTLMTNVNHSLLREAAAAIEEFGQQHERDTTLWTIKERFRLQLEHLADRLHEDCDGTCEAIRLDQERQARAGVRPSHSVRHRDVEANVSDVDDFMEGLTALTLKTGIIVGACGECESPWVGPIDAQECVDENGEDWRNDYWRDDAILVSLEWNGEKYEARPNHRYKAPDTQVSKHE